MRIFTRVLISAVLLIMILVVFMAASRGWWLADFQSATIMAEYRRDCPPERRDIFGNCPDEITRTFRYYASGRSFMGGSGGGGGK